MSDAPSTCMKATAKRQDHHEAELFVFMHGSHQTLERLFEKLILAVTADDRIEMHAIWEQVESKLLAHLEAEERFVLPAFAKSDRKEATELVREHGKIRELLLELGVAIELHYARLAPFQLFMGMLREHAQREETLLYRWASSMLEARLATAAIEHVNGK